MVGKKILHIFTEIYGNRLQGAVGLWQLKMEGEKLLERVDSGA